ECVISYEEMYANFDQNDSHEFLDRVLNILHEELKNKKIEDTLSLKAVYIDYKDLQNEILNHGSHLWKCYLNSLQSFIAELFHSLTYEKIQCLECNQISVKFDLSNGLVLPLPEVQNQISKKRKYADCFLTLHDCLNEHFKIIHTNTPENYCRNCCRKTKSEEQFQLFNLPKIFIIQLNRFQCDNFFNKTKNDQFIEFFENIDLNKYTNDRKKYSKYELVAVSNHFGSLYNGHYTTHAKNDKSEQWFNFNDENVTNIGGSIVTQNAFFLVYVLDGKSDTTVSTTSSDGKDCLNPESSLHEYDFCKRKKKRRFNFSLALLCNLLL
ncbi:ubiquitin carboxyl-terminal hydrolase 2 isoform X1, partial [Brachionus plicatilis]